MKYEAFPVYGDADRARILKLWSENFGNERIRSALDARWRWLLSETPAGPVNLFVIVDNDSGTIVGSTSALPRRMRIRSQEIRAALLCDFVIDKKHRVAGPAVTLQRFVADTCFKNGFDLLYGFPNDGAFPVLARVGYRAIGMASVWFRPLRSSRKLREIVPAPLASTAGFFVDRALQSHEFLLHLSLGRKYRGALTKTPDPSVDDLWDRAQSIHSIAGERTASFLHWRYSQHPIEQCGFFSLKEVAGGRLRAFVVYSVFEAKVSVLDAFWDSLDVLEPMYLEFTRQMRIEGHDSITVCHVGNEQFIRPLRLLGFVRSKQQRRFICKVGGEQGNQVAEVAHDVSQWSLFEGELDL